MVQRESILFATKLDKTLKEFAVEMDQEVISNYLSRVAKNISLRGNLDSLANISPEIE